MVVARHKGFVSRDLRRKRQLQPRIHITIKEDGTVQGRNDQEYENLQEVMETARRINADVIADDRRPKK